MDHRFSSTKLMVAITRGALTLALLAALLLVAARPVRAQTETVLYNFTGGSDGASPQFRLTFDAAGNLYGTTVQGGIANVDYPEGSDECSNCLGTVTELVTAVLYAFNGGLNVGPDGTVPSGPVIFDKAGNLYGTTNQGGTDFYYCGYGTVFELSPGQTTWTETILYSLNCNLYLLNGVLPTGGVIMDATGNLYGSTTANDAPVPGRC